MEPEHHHRVLAMDMGRVVDLHDGTHLVFDDISMFNDWRWNQNYLEAISPTAEANIEEGEEAGVLLSMKDGELVWIGETFWRIPVEDEEVSAM